MFAGEDHTGEKSIVNKLNKTVITDDCYFDSIYSAEKQYVLGWIFAKGHVFRFRNIKRAGCSIIVHERDKHILNHMKVLLSVKRPILIESKKGRNYARLTVDDHKIYERLIKLGLKPVKNNGMKYPANAIANHAAFILGYFEGNGMIILSDKSRGPTFEIVGPESMLVTIRDIFARELSLPSVPITSRENEYRITYSGILIVNKFGDWLYSWKPRIYLDRKKAKFDELPSINSKSYLMVNFICPQCGKQDIVAKLTTYLVSEYGSRKYCSMKCSINFLDNIQ